MDILAQRVTLQMEAGPEVACQTLGRSDGSRVTTERKGTLEGIQGRILSAFGLCLHDLFIDVQQNKKVSKWKYFSGAG